MARGLLATAGLLVLNPLKNAFAENYAASKAEPDLLARINRAKDPGTLRGLEVGHAPQIKSPDAVKAGEPFEVEVAVGQKLHEMIPTHYIDWIDLYAGEIFLTKMVLTPNLTQPVFKTMLVLRESAALRAVEHCNIHGLWEGTKRIEVV
ncbi:MAG: desulfoferrodoxin [Nitrospinae bacterium]|nr:desulfoferrodoxin [Nitrospinota bacterium]